MKRAAIMPWLAISLVALALMIPALSRPPFTHDSFWIDISWADQFTAELRRGVLWPRWLPASHDGLGAPVFYFYPPAAFWLTGLFGLAGLATWPALLASFGTLLWASGATMYLWLRDRAQRPLAGALLYMAMPYHLFDFYRRGALAEFAAFALFPLIAMALRRASEGRGFGALAFAYALLIMTHLPTALLTSIFLVIPYGLALRKGDLRAMATGLAMGIGLAAAYLVPALSLQHAVAIDQLWALGQYQTGRWNIWHPDQWASPGGMQLMLAFAGILVFGALCCRGGFWSRLAIGIALVVIGIIPGFWTLPLIANVQFPWRALAIAEFAFVTGFASGAIAPVRLVLAALPALTFATLFLRPYAPPDLLSPAEILAHHHDVPEYLPAGVPSPQYWYSRWALALAGRQPPLSIHDGVTTMRRFDFPAWQVRCGGRIVPHHPDSRTRLLSWRGEGCAVSRVLTAPERAGYFISLLVLVAFAAQFVIRGRHRG